MSVLVIALLFFGLMMLVLAESAGALRGARRFRARVTSQVNAESAAEVVAASVIAGGSGRMKIDFDDGMGTAEGTSRSTPAGTVEFEVSASGTAARVTSPARVKIWGESDGANVRVTRTVHSQ